LYGRDIGNGSLAMVTRGFREALESADLLEGFVALDRSGGSEEDDAPPGALARDGIFTGNLSHLGMMTQGARHERHWVTVTPNSTHVPPRLLDAILRLPNPRILSASAWGTGVILRALQAMGAWMISTDGVKASARFGTSPNTQVRVEIHTVRHGVSGFTPVPTGIPFHKPTIIDKTREDFHMGRHRVVHFSTTDGERKGTLELIKAWGMFLSTVNVRCDPELVLVLDHHARAALSDRMLDQAILMPERVRLLPRGDMDPKAMSSFLSEQHLVCCPSRGEGFSLLPLQARACGVPVATTITTGCSAGHCSGAGVVVIEQEPHLRPIDDGPGALAPVVNPERIASAIKVALGSWPTLSLAARAAAPQVTKDWSWQTQLAPLVKELR